ncbi:CGNR zinc finger domain-containing protein [Streptomyces qinzhouensis]|uniref:CGNR zinc finger domain-containing protein n=1 Tax=Streptomyces qinzhouensis TaxID=2599401 RepID=A0A5B8IEL7_9ACTN|nr:CGNR zinc finger domain-containing protein [Streptomyces qinzhouensis]QDY76978.1 CGNR zinc finger domain-containing protein [Streptomyces qinzhouensis]
MAAHAADPADRATRSAAADALDGPARYHWRFDTGRLCLDLVATGDSAPGAVPRDEPLAGEGRLRRWLVGAGLVPPGTPLPADCPAWVQRFTELRGHLTQVVLAEIDGRPAAPAAPADAGLDRVNALAAGAPPPVRAVREPSGTLVRGLVRAPECAELLAAVARDAVELLTDPAVRALLRQCEGEGCRRVYVDTSRGSRRRWCSSEVCGNRERVARHRRRAAAALART